MFKLLKSLAGFYLSLVVQRSSLVRITCGLFVAAKAVSERNGSRRKTCALVHTLPRWPVSLIYGKRTKATTPVTWRQPLMGKGTCTKVAVAILLTLIYRSVKP